MSTDPSSSFEDPGTSPQGDAGASSAISNDVHRMRYQQWFELGPDSLIVTDGHGIILEANHAASQLFRCAKDFLIGKPLGLLMRNGHKSRFYESLARYGSTGGSDEFEARVQRRDSVRDVEVRVCFGLPGESNSITSLWLIRDVTERRRAEAARVDLLRRLGSSQDDERRRIARELHDHLGQELTTLTLGLNALDSELPAESPARQRLRLLQETVDRLSRQSHALALELHPTILSDLGLGAALEMLVRQWSERIGVSVDYHFAAKTLKCTPDVEMTVFRIVQEALTNVAKHARASHASVIVEYSEGQLVAIVEDDGVGFCRESHEVIGRLGLAGMSERVFLVGGTLHVESSPDAGTTIRARIPCSESREKLPHDQTACPAG